MAHPTVATDEQEMAVETAYAGRQTRGARVNQEDAYGVVPSAELGGGRTLLAIVADGMGGHAAGEIASGLAVQGFVDGFFEDEAADDPSRFWDGLEEANRRIAAAVRGRADLAGMGTTLVAVLLRQGTVRWISVGDSPLYLIRGGSLRRLNALHVSARTETGGGGLASAVIGERLFQVDDDKPVPLMPGDRVLVASDGLNTLTEVQILDIFKQTPEATAATQAARLLEAVEACGRPRQDNTTVIVIHWN